MPQFLHGQTGGLIYGNPSMTGYIFQTFDRSSKAANVFEVFNESGNRVASRYDDLTTEMSIEAIFAGATLPIPGATFTTTFDSVSYETLSVDVKRVNKGFQTVNIKCKVSEYLTP